jgi:hypothetical protein
LLIKIPLNKEIFFPSLKGPRNGTSLHVPQNQGPVETDARFKTSYTLQLNGNTEPSEILPNPFAKTRQTVISNATATE